MIIFNPVLILVRDRPETSVAPFPSSAVLADWFLGERKVGFGQLVWFDMAHGPADTPWADEALQFRGGEAVDPAAIPEYGAFLFTYSGVQWLNDFFFRLPVHQLAPSSVPGFACPAA